MKAFFRFLCGDPAGSPADGRGVGLGLTAALRKHWSADEADRYLRRWAAGVSEMSRER
ncbi:hypothetical protein [Thermoactinospora rubra]|uniref:hypothetical protein n=1 Tax=Thermoactinospora rubra TaxID=1088767 RepID=UPI001301AD0A|nr:hypothetical protein [Thermoactinospora rubra]